MSEAISTLSKDVFTVTTNSCAFIPTKEKTRVEFTGADIEYAPFMSVNVPEVVPFIVTLTPGSVRPSSADVTTPFTIMFWALTAREHRIRRIDRIVCFINK